MPRLLVRLVESVAAVDKHSSRITTPTRHPTKKTLHKPTPPRPTFSAPDYAQSILLAPLNPVLNRKHYVRHKSLPPRLRAPRHPAYEHDQPRAMTADERSWWDNPYLRMLATPLRQCILTKRHFPTDFLIRLAPMRLPLPRHAPHSTTQVLIPDGLEHTQFKVRKSGKAVYIVCRRDALAHLAERGVYKRFAPNVFMHALLPQQIAHLLRVRVLQELDLLADALQSSQPANPPILRRLTRAEFAALRDHSIVPDPDALAILVVPPLNRDPLTRTRPQPSLSTAPPPPDPAVATRPQLHPQSTLYHVHTPTPDFLPDTVPAAQIPLYNGVPLFPARTQRAALHAVLSRILQIERRARYSANHPSPGVEPEHPEPVLGDRRASHAFLLKTGKADTAAVAVALWRVRMFDGAGWDDDPGWVRKIT